MSSIIYRDHFPENSLNFTALTVGSKGDVCNFLKYATKEFNNHFNNNSVFIISDRALTHAESKPHLLSKSTKIKSNILGGNLNKDYYGYFINQPNDIALLYDYLFAYNGPFDCRNNNYPPHFSETKMFELLENCFNNSTNLSTDTDISDILLHFEFKRIAINTYMAKIHCSICASSIKESFSSYLEWYKNLIMKFDDLFYNSFHSAYISYSPRDFAIVHSSIYNCINIEDVISHLLGWEWCNYISNRFFKMLSQENVDRLSETYNLEKLSNGIIFTSCVPYEQYGKSEYKTTYPTIKKLLIPGVGMITWEMLCKNPHNAYYPVKNVIVYSYASNDYLLLLPFGCTKDKIEEITGYNVNEAWKIYSLNEDFY